MDMNWAERLEDDWKHKDEIRGIRSGIIEFDEITRGFQPEKLYTVAGRTGMGKSSFLTSVALNILPNNRVTIMTLEMSAYEVFKRIISSKIGKNIKNWSTNEFQNILRLKNDKYFKNLDICDKGGLNLNDIRQRIELKKPEIVFVDHIGLMKSIERKQSRNYEIEEITGGLKTIAKEYKIPVVMLCQINRSLEQERKVDNKKPSISELRDSGSVEQDSDVIALLYRKYYYLINMKPENMAEILSWEMECDKYRNKASIIIGKNRDGACGTIDVGFIPEITTFKDL